MIASRKIHRCSLLALALTLSACAQMAADPADPGAPLVAPSGQSEAAPQREKQHKSVLQDPHYHLMRAEFALQEQRWDDALAAFRQALFLADDPSVAERTLGVAVYAKKPEIAREAALRWAALAPDAPDAALSAVAWLTHTNNITAAVGYVQRYISQQNDTQSALRDIGETLLQQRAPLPHARALFQALVATQPQQAAVHYWLGVMTFAQSPIKAAEHANKALQLAPDHTAAHLLRAKALIQLGRKALALQTLQATTTAQPDNVDLQLAAAEIFVNNKRLQQAKSMLNNVLRQDPAQPDAQLILAVIDINEGRIQAARKRFNYLAANDQHHDAASYYLGGIAYAEKRYDDAVTWYSQVRGGEYLFEAQYQLARISAHVKDYPKALERLRKLRQVFPKNMRRLFVAEANVLNSMGEYQEAYTLYSVALVQYPQDRELLYGRSMASEKLKKISEVEKDLKKLLELEPHDPQALNALGYTLATHTQRYQEAYGYITRALTLEPNSPEILDSMGWVLYRLGRPNEALGYLKKAYKQQPVPEIAAHLGEVFWALGQRGQAKKVWQASSREYSDSRGDIVRQIMKRYLP